MAHALETNVRKHSSLGHLNHERHEINDSIIHMSYHIYIYIYIMQYQPQEKFESLLCFAAFGYCDSQAENFDPNSGAQATKDILRSDSDGDSKRKSRRYVCQDVNW